MLKSKIMEKVIYFKNLECKKDLINTLLLLAILFITTALAT